jgi:membrane fusion protein (multidrug efflux system)
VAQGIQRDVPVYVEAIGETRGSQEVEIRARVEGVLESVNFQEGTDVRKGQLLHTIDPREYEAAVA